MSIAYTTKRKNRSENEGYLGTSIVFLSVPKYPGGGGNSIFSFSGGQTSEYKHIGKNIRSLMAKNVEKIVK